MTGCDGEALQQYVVIQFTFLLIHEGGPFFAIFVYFGYHENSLNVRGCSLGANVRQNSLLSLVAFRRVDYVHATSSNHRSVPLSWIDERGFTVGSTLGSDFTDDKIHELQVNKE